MRPVRTVLHAHSHWSYDAKWPLERIARTYDKLGVDAVMMTEHDTGFDPDRFAEYRAECAAASTSRCTLVPGIEYSDPDNVVHILTWGLHEFLAEHRPVLDTLRDVTERRGAAIFAHPVRRRAWTEFDPAWIPHLSAIELWNRKSDGITWGTEAARLVAETGLPATVGQDFHHPRLIYPLTMVLPVQAGAEGGTELEAALVDALRDGRGEARIFGRPVLDRRGRPRPFPHNRLDALDRARRRLRDRLRRRRS